MKRRGKIAFMLSMSLLLQGFPELMPQKAEAVMTEVSQIVMPEAGNTLGTVTAYAEDTPSAAAATATPTPTPVPTSAVDKSQISFYFMYEGANYHQEDTIELKSNITSQTLSIVCSLGYIEPGTRITGWHSFDDTIIDVKTRTDGGTAEAKQLLADVEIKGIGTTSLGAIVEDAQGNVYNISCQVQVPFDLMDEDKADKINSSEDDLGMIDSVRYNETQNMKVIQLTTEEDEAHSHYLPMFEFVNYKDGVNSMSSKEDFGGSLVEYANDLVPFLVDITGTDTTVATVDQYGYIEAVGAGYTTVKITTLDGKQSKEFHIVVTPKARVKDSGTAYTADLEVTTQPGQSTVTLDTNAGIAENLNWTLRKDYANNNDTLRLNNNPYMKVELSKNDGVVTLSQLKAGVYYLTGYQKEYAETNTRIKKLTIKLVVPIGISESRLIMNVGDTYNVLENANILDKTLFTYSVVTEKNGNSPSNVASVSDGILTALTEGDAYLVLQYQEDKDIFAGGEENAYQKVYNIPITVIDGLSLNLTTATLYVGGKLQLQAVTSNRSVPLVWTSSDESVLTVDGDGLVTGVKEGTATITVSQTINGVTKTARCTILVVASVTSIVLDPQEKEIGVGDLLTINANVTPKVNGVSLKWVTSDESVVSIEQSGDLSTTVKGQSEGVAVVMAINQDNIVVGSCLITVSADHSIKRITLSQTSVTTALSAKNFMLYATITPADAANEPIVWSSSDTSIVTVDQNGLVTLKKSGTVTIICTAKNDSTISSSCRVTITQGVTGIKLDQTSINMNVGETFRLTYVLSPSNASNTAVTWTSANPSIATVNANGLVSAKGVGQTAIILKTNDGGYMATCLVNVGRVATAVRLDVTSIVLNVGDYYTFETTVTPADSTETTLTWEVSDKSIAVVSNKGKLTAKKAGVAVVMAKTKSGSTAYCTVTVQQGVTGVKLDDHEGRIYVGEEWELNATVTPNNATLPDVTWSSSNRSVATVDRNGRVRGVSEGLTIITCTTEDGGYVDYCAVLVEPNEVESEDIKITPESVLLGVGKTRKLEIEFIPAETTNQDVEWSSSDTDVVTVDEKGRLRGISIGTATVTCTAADGGAQAYCEVEVCQQITDIRLDTNYLNMVVGESRTLQGWIYPSDATYGVVWECEDPSIAVVDRQNGRVTALKAGDTQIRAIAEDESGIEAICVVHVRNPVAITNIQVSESELVMVPGENKTVSFTILPAGYTDTYEWSSDNPVVASVDKSSGLITANAMGTANITILASSGRSASIKIYVVGLSKTSLTLEQYTSTLISLEVYGASSADLDVRWYSDNERIAEVSNGKITGKAIGSTYVYAVVNGRKLACRVTVERIRR